MKAFESIEDIIKAIEEHPEWRVPLLRALGLGELITLPEKVEAYQQENRARFDRLEQAMVRLFEGLEELRQVVQRLEQGYQEHSRILQEHSRILQEHTQTLQEHSQTLQEHSRILRELVEEVRRLREGYDEHSRILQEHTQTLQEHSQTLQEHSRILRELVEEVRRLREGYDEHSRILQEHTQTLQEHSQTLQEHSRILRELVEEVRRLREGYDEHSRILQEHSRILQEHTQTLREHSQTLQEHSRTLLEHTQILQEHTRMLQELVAEMRESRARQDTFERTLLDLYASHRALERTVEKLAHDVAILKGSDRERYYRERAHAIFGRYLRKVRLVDIGDLLDEIEQRAEISPEEEEELINADAIFSAVNKRTREPIYVVMETSWVVDQSDLERAIRRAEILKRLGYPAVPAVGGVEIDAEVLRLSIDNEVVLTVNGRTLGDVLLT